MGAEFADHVLDGVTWTLARDPEMGKPSHYAPHIYILKTVTVAGVSELVFYYKFDDEEVTLLGCVFAHEL